MATKAINFRSTSGYVTDDASETYCLAADSYPTTRNGMTFGVSAGFITGAADRDSALDRRLAGIMYKTNGGAQFTVRIDLDSSGDKLVRLALGDGGSAQAYQYLEVKDDSSSLFIIDDTNGTSSANFDDANGTNHTAANWPANNTSRAVTFTSTICNVLVGTPDAQSGFSTLAHVYVEDVSSAVELPEIGLFDGELRPEAWFSHNLVALGWFDETLITALTDQVVVPATVNLSLTSFAPQLQETITPTTVALTTATFAPVLNTGVTPTTLALATTTFAPTLHSTITPTTVALTVSTFAPVIKETATPTTVSLTLTTFEPTVAITVLVVPDTATLVLTTFAPTVINPQSAIPTTASLTLTTFEPLILIPQTVTPDTAVLVTTTFAPTPNVGVNVQPTTASLSIITFAPQLHDSITPNASTLTITTFGPRLDEVLNLAAPTALVLTTFIPTVGEVPALSVKQPTSVSLNTNGRSSVSVNNGVASATLNDGTSSTTLAS